MKPALQATTLAALACLAPGCGTLMRGNDPVRAADPVFSPFVASSRVYPATSCDVAFVQKSGGWGFPVCLIDLPFSLTTDTLLLPYDLATRSKKSDSQTSMMQAAQQAETSRERELLNHRAAAEEWLTTEQAFITGLSVSNVIYSGDEFSEASHWLKAEHPNQYPPFGWADRQRFASYEAAIAFVDSLYAAGAKRVYLRHRCDDHALILHLPDTGQEPLRKILAAEETTQGLQQLSAADGKLTYTWWGSSTEPAPP